VSELLRFSGEKLTLGALRADHEFLARSLLGVPGAMAGWVPVDNILGATGEQKAQKIGRLGLAMLGTPKWREMKFPPAIYHQQHSHTTTIADYTRRVSSFDAKLVIGGESWKASTLNIITQD
jgi:hypothetical protein